MSDTCEITLEQLLEAREKRASKQRELISRFNKPLISITLNIPGKYKRTPLSSSIFKEGCNALLKKLEECKKPLMHFEMSEPVTGQEAYAVVDYEENELKSFVLQLENGHKLGRMWDFDVVRKNGDIVSREDLGYPKRKCLLCGKDAHLCTRSRAHPIELLIEKIEEITRSYLKEG